MPTWAQTRTPLWSRRSTGGRRRLEITDLHVGYHRDLHILRGVRLRARAGQITAVLGANGTGKSTLLKTVAGFLRPAKGQITVAGDSVIGLPPHAMIRRGIAYIPQHPGIFAHMTVEENLLMGAWSFRSDRARVRAKLADNYDRFPALAQCRRQYAGRLSGGQQRMVEIGRTMMSNPRLLLVDEPTAGLAKLVRRDVYQMLTQLRDEGPTVLLVVQEIRDALKIADYAYVVDLGRNRADGPPSQFADLRTSLWV